MKQPAVISRAVLAASSLFRKNGGRKVASQGRKQPAAGTLLNIYTSAGFEAPIRGRF
jgi:hypothetical protein